MIRTALTNEMISLHNLRVDCNHLYNIYLMECHCIIYETYTKNDEMFIFIKE
jgi:hypothetical protein